MGSEFQNPAGAAGVLTMPIDSQSPWQNGKTERVGQSFKHQLWDLDEECHIKGETEFEAAVAECCDARNRYCNLSGFSAHQRVFGSSLRLPGSLLSDDPTDRQLLTADPYTNFHRANEMRTAAQRALIKQNSAHAVQAAGLARHRSQPTEDINVGDTTMVWRNNQLTGRKGWTGPGVVVAVSPTRTSFWISMRGCLLKCSSEQVRKATDAERLGAELSKTLATELLKSRQRSGQRGYVDVETEGQSTEEPPVDTRPDVSRVLGAVVPAPSVLAPIPEEFELMDTTMTEAAESGPETRPRQPESEPGVNRNVRPRLALDQEVTQMDEVENSQSTTQARGDVDQIPDGAHVDNPPDAASSTPSPNPLTSASNYLTVLPVETEFDSKAQAVVHGSADAVIGQDSTTFKSVEGMAVFDDETRAFWVAPRPKDKSGVVYDEDKFDASRFKEIDNVLKLNALSVMSPKESDHFAKTTPENIIPTNMLDKWKLQDDGTVAAKSRSALVGWKDPMIYQLERAAPTPTQEGIMVTLQRLASAKVTGGIPDLTNAFGQARKTSRKNKLATKLALGVTETVVACWLAAGYVKNPYDKCLFTLFSSDETSEAQLLLDVDDFIEGGKETHRKTMEEFYDKYRCGKAVDLVSAGQEGTRFAGRRVVQNPDLRITVSMDQYVKSKLHPIEVPKGYLSNTKEMSDGMFTNIKGVNGGLGWLASTARPDMAAPHSIIRSGHDRRSPQLISEVNAAVKQCHAVPITITIWPIPFAEVRWTTFTDSGFDTGERQRHQQGWLVCHKQVLQPRTVGASECASLAESEAHTKSGESTTGRD